LDEIGNILRDAREAKGLSHAEVYEKIRITPKFIKAMEEGQYDALPSPAHIRGYLRKYARHLDLEADPLLERYEVLKTLRPKEPVAIREIKAPPQLASAVLPEPETGTFFNHMNADVSNGSEEAEQGGDWVGRVIILALIIFSGLLLWRLIPFALGDNANRSLVDAVSEILLNAEEEPAADPVIVNNLAADPELTGGEVLTTTELIVSTGRTTGGTVAVEQSENGQVQFIAPEPTRNPLPATIEVINMTIEIVENRTWLRVTADDIVLFEGQADQGDIQNYTANDFVNIRTGNASGVLVTINDIEIGLLGERGQVADQTWETTQ